MGHKTLIGGTAYQISGGKTLVGGTAYSIKNGKTLIGGTAYEVGFAKPMVNVTLEADLPTNSSTYFSIICRGEDGISYIDSISSAGTYAVPIGGKIEFIISPSSSRGNCFIYLNDEEVVSVYDGEEAYYLYTLTTNITISYMQTPIGGYFYIYEE